MQACHPKISTDSVGQCGDGGGVQAAVSLPWHINIAVVVVAVAAALSLCSALCRVAIPAGGSSMTTLASARAAVPVAVERKPDRPQPSCPSQVILWLFCNRVWFKLRTFCCMHACLCVRSRAARPQPKFDGLFGGGYSESMHGHMDGRTLSVHPRDSHWTRPL